MTSPLGFRAAFRRLALLFSAISLCVYPYAWFRHPGIVPFLDHAFEYQIPVLLTHVCLAWAASRGPAQCSGYDDEFESEGFDEPELIVINPGSGLPMIGGMGGVDSEGNSFGSHSDD
jgi:hypothetical protein